MTSTLAPATTPVISLRGLTKHYGTTRAVRGIDLEVYQGEIFGLIGPDGAGKTTTFQILAGVMEASDGVVTVLQRSPRDARLGIGYLTQQFSLYMDLSVNENIRYTAGLRQVLPLQLEARRQKYLKLMNLDQFGDRLAGRLSGGMRQKLALCCAVIAQPQLLLLDEPTTGVDPVSRREFWEILSTLVTEGTTVVLATPYLDEAERCNRVALMYDGKIHEVGTPHQLKQNLGLHRLELRLDELAAAEQILLTASQSADAGPLADVQTFGDRLDVLVPDLAQGEATIRRLLAQHHLYPKTLDLGEPTLENVFVTRLRQQGAAPPYLPFPQSNTPGASHQRPLASPTAAGSPPQPPPAIFARQLTRTFGSFTAVKNLDLEIHYGEIFGLLGANGAGKTTTIKMLCGLLEPSSGEIALGGETGDLRSAALRRRIGYMSQKFTLYDDLSVLQNLEFYSGVYGVPRQLRRERIDWVLETCGLVGQESLLTGRLPGGWKQRVAFGAAVLHQPDILFLDEPTSGVDPLARRQFWRFINDFARQGTAILVTTHYLEEAEQCNRMAFLTMGTKVAEGSPSQIKAAQPGQLVEVSVDQVQQAAELLKTWLAPWRVSIFARTLHVVLDAPPVEIPQVRQFLQEAGMPVRSLHVIPFSLEDAFIGIIQRAADHQHT
ncbi:MAG TPA: ABC transporter ATP-binding protein [Synechococcales cyanobacterium M55_K2018_004]|nr:ABC transporter ATP-binding protein [Synechococcales cyanobacterium M55_K2018_004]